ncbi:MAG: M20/M25/M40 family metallo-hydrolase, partial [Desulfobacterales bacterium]
IIKRLEELVGGIAKSYDVRLVLEIISGYPVLVNDFKLVRHTKRCASEILGADHVHTDLPRMGAEDFAFFCQMWPGVMVGLGCHDLDKGFQYGLHSCHFDFDERVLDVGTRLFARILTRYIENRVTLHEN